MDYSWIPAKPIANCPAPLLLLPDINAAKVESGLKAIQAGDYATALKILKPLAEQGNPVAQ